MSPKGSLSPREISKIQYLDDQDLESSQFSRKRQRDQKILYQLRLCEISLYCRGLEEVSSSSRKKLTPWWWLCDFCRGKIKCLKSLRSLEDSWRISTNMLRYYGLREWCERQRIRKKSGRRILQYKPLQCQDPLLQVGCFCHNQTPPSEHYDTCLTVKQKISMHVLQLPLERFQICRW